MGQIFTGNLTSVWVNTDTTNTDPNSKSFSQVQDLSAFPSFAESTASRSVETYNAEYTYKAMGESTYQDMTLQVSYVPSVHSDLDALVDSQELVQVKVEMPDEGMVIWYLVPILPTTITLLPAPMCSHLTHWYLQVSSINLRLSCIVVTGV